MNVELRRPDELTPYANNPRVNDSAVDAVANSLKEFGFRQPIVIDEVGTIVCGHTRWKAAVQLGLEQVPVHVAKDLTSEQLRAYRIADNQTACLAVWDFELLPLELIELKDLDYDISLLGFDEAGLQKILEGTGNPGLVDADIVPEPPDDPIIQPGDLWILGKHRLLCGDSGSKRDLDRLLDRQPVHLVNTDPPYGVKVEPRSNNAIASGLSSFQATHHQKLDAARHPEKAQPTANKMRAKDRPLVNDFVSDVEFDALLEAWFGNIARVLEPGRSFYIWGGYANLGNYPPFLKRHDLYFSQAIIWHKL
ncbi:MAG: ParB N-terminal domain-containing protein, partial [Phycisphaerales bacterium]|nr:ParB N-terminal domain-containing protein [Phycisphaerales bacterium]